MRRFPLKPSLRAFLAALCCALSLVAWSAPAPKPPLWKLVAAQISYTAQGPFGPFTATSRQLAAKVTFDPRHPSSLRGLLEVPSSSFHSSNALRDIDARREVFMSQRFPVIRLRLEQLRGWKGSSGTAAVILSGQLTLDGVTHPVVVRGFLSLAGSEATFRGSFTLSLTAYRIKPPQLLFWTVGSRVTISVAVKAEEAPS